MRFLTLDALLYMPHGARACDPAVEWFVRVFPDGGKWSEVWDACPVWQWRVWFAIRSAPTKKVLKFVRSCASRAADYAALQDAELLNAALSESASKVASYALAVQTYADDRWYATAYAYACAAARETEVTAHLADDSRGASAQEKQEQIAWARRILFGESP